MVDDLGAAAAQGAVEGPVIVQGEQVSDLPVAAALGFAAADSLAGVLDDLAPRGYALAGVTPGGESAICGCAGGKGVAFVDAR